MMHIIILTQKPVYNPIIKRISIGGTETYVYELAKTCIMAGYEVSIYQKWDTEFIETYNSVSFRGVVIKKNIELFKLAHDAFGDKVIYIISDDNMRIKVPCKKAIVIQHGIGWDYPEKRGKFLIFKSFIKLLTNIYHIYMYHFVKNMVCVDYNYFNWIRTVHQLMDGGSIKVIPNFASSYVSEEMLISKLNSSSKNKSIVFARRFVEYRGTKVFVSVIKRLLNNYPDLKVTIAGEGPDEPYMREEMKDYLQVSFTSFSCTESVNFHYNYDIAVVPTIYSEGTSLSLCEAMAAGCYPIATHVGGMTNLIIDGFNGSFSYISETALYNKLEEVINMDLHEFRKVVHNAWETVHSSLSIEKWRKAWINYIQEIETLQ